MSVTAPSPGLLLHGPVRRYAQVRALAETQHGNATHAQLRGLGFSQDEIDRRVRAGMWPRAGYLVYRVGGPACTPQKVLAAVLAAGEDALASHRSAARIWELRGLKSSNAIDVINPERGRVRGVRGSVHRADGLWPGDRRTRNGIPVTSPLRTILDLPSVAGPRTVAAALDDALRRGLLYLPTLLYRIDQRGTRGRKGLGELRRMVVARLGKKGFTESELEDALRDLLAASGLPEPVKQYRVVVQGHRYRLDCAYPDLQIDIEAHSDEWHASVADRREDASRLTELAVDGWMVLLITHTDITTRPAWVVDRIGKALERRSGSARISA